LFKKDSSALQDYLIDQKYSNNSNIGKYYNLKEQFSILAVFSVT